MNPVEVLRRKWQEWTGEEETPFDGDTPAWMFSLALHLGVLVTMAILFLPPKKLDRELTVTTLDNENPVEEMQEVFNFNSSDSAQSEAGSSSLAGTDTAMALAQVLNDTSQMQNDAVEQVEIASIALPVLDELTAAPTVSKDMVVKGASGVSTTGASGAVDRLTQEIADSLEKRRTLVVWVLDQSLSMQPQRQTIVERLDRIYQELGVAATGGGDEDNTGAYAPLMSAVMAFGKNVTFRTKEPTAEVEEVKKAVAGIENDPSGVEMTFTAVGMAANKFAPYRTKSPRRNVMIIVFSDEVGDDEMKLEDTLAACRRHEMPVYVVGVPAPFGRRDVEVKYVDPDPKFDQGVMWLPVRQGPESLYPEEINLGFAGGRHDDLSRLASGFGPFALTRLCCETGGTYFTVHPNNHGAGKRQGDVAKMSARLDYFFDPAIMRSYQPEYVSIREYEQKLAHNKARAALVKAATMSMVDPMENPRLEFPKVDEAALKRLLDEAQKSAAKLGPKLEATYQVLKQGEKDRARLTEPRWQAGYDLAMGRVLAVKVRTESYNAMLAKAKGGLKFQKPESDTFVLVAADEISVGSQIEKMAKQARDYLERVKQQHAGTPWALLAERELEEPIGWKWSEKTTGVNKPKMGAGGGNNAPPADALRKLEKPKPKREGIKL